MFVSYEHHRAGYNRDGNQFAQGYFLMLFCRPDAKETYEQSEHEKLYACVRYVRLSQLGHWMMGYAHVGGKKFTLSGELGNDGLPMSSGKFGNDPAIAMGEWKRLLPRLTLLPKEIAARYWTDSGHNAVGPNSREALRAFGLALFKQTYRLSGRWNKRYRIVKPKETRPLANSQ